MTDFAETFAYQRSWALEPLFYRAPFPETKDGREPHPYQHAAVEYALSRKHCIIGDAPGVGKTAEAVLLSNAIEAKKTLVVCPASLVLNWEREIWTWSTTPNVRTYPILRGKDGVATDADYLILSYNMLQNYEILDAIMDQHWDHLVCDEAHKLKDPKGNKTTQIICAPDELPSVVGRMTLLSGTLLPNQPIEAYNALRLCDWDAIDRMSVERFRDHYYEEGGGMIRGRHAVAQPDGSVVWETGLHYSKTVRNVPVNHEELNWRMRHHIMVRRLKEHVLPQLPPKQWHPVPLPLDSDMRRAMKHPGWTEAERLYEMDPDAFDRGVPIDGAISTARLELGRAKAPGALRYIEELLSEGVEKLIVSAWHSEVLAFLRENLQHHGLVYMDGSTSARKRQAVVDEFQENPEIRIILAQQLVLMLGWTLVAAQDVVLAEYDWVPGNNDQLLDRVHRMGQKGTVVTGHVPVVPGTLDERMLGTAIAKDQHIHRALDVRSR